MRGGSRLGESVRVRPVKGNPSRILSAFVCARESPAVSRKQTRPTLHRMPPTESPPPSIHHPLLVLRFKNLRSGPVLLAPRGIRAHTPFATARRRAAQETVPTNSNSFASEISRQWKEYEIDEILLAENKEHIPTRAHQATRRSRILLATQRDDNGIDPSVVSPRGRDPGRADFFLMLIICEHYTLDILVSLLLIRTLRFVRSCNVVATECWRFHEVFGSGRSVVGECLWLEA